MANSKKPKPSGLELMREPFKPNQISKLPKPTRGQTDEVKADFKKGIRCRECNGWHHPKVVHLDYVGHAALTDRLLDCDTSWNWRPLSVQEGGNPTFDDQGGLWIELTVCGVARLGYGDAQGKSGPNATKEAIGDALRNAAMRFGAALDLWHKGDLHGDDDASNDPPFDAQAAKDRIAKKMNACKTKQQFAVLWKSEIETTNKIGAADRVLGVQLYNLRDKLISELPDEGPSEDDGQ